MATDEGSGTPVSGSRDSTETTTTRDGRAVELVDDPGAGRFEARIDGSVVGVVEYQTTESLVVMTHTETDGSVAGQGVAGSLVRFALDRVRDGDGSTRPAGPRSVLPVCPFVAGYLARHPEEYPDLDYRSRTTVVHD